MSPQAPKPSGPTDQVGAVWAEGVVTSGGSGPCYAMTTDDGTAVSMYTSEDLGLTEGERIRARVSPASFTTECSGDVMRLLEVERH